jgi:uncharacterized protein (TIGR03435 family)
MINRSSRLLELRTALLRTIIATMIVAVPMVGQPPAAPAQEQAHNDVVGDWQGTLEFPASGNRPSAKYRLVLKVAKSPDGGLTALNYTIDQGPTPMRTAAVTLQGSTFKFSIPALNGSYEGQLSTDGNSIKGTWTQGAALPLNFVRATKETAWDIPAPPAPARPMAAVANPSFSVTTIKPANPSPSTATKIIRLYGGHYITQNTSLADLIEVAYGTHPAQIIGAPAWVVDDKFDFVGVPDGEGEPSIEQWLTMVQKMLADRFKLTFHHENKELSVYLLSVGKSGPKNFVKSDSTSPFPSGLEFRPSPGGLLLPAQNATLGQFCQMMQQVVLDRPVIDKTDLAGKFDFQLKFMPDDSQFSGHPPRLPSPPDTTTSSPGLFDAIQQQLGLKLASGKAPIDVLVIDHVEKPSAN